MNRPAFITFTGADDLTAVSGMATLSARYPIEWGILLSPTRQGADPRFPSGQSLSRFMWSGQRLAAHVCGEYSRAIMEGRRFHSPVDFSYFNRVQINHAAPIPRKMVEFRRGWGRFRCVAQSRSIISFPTDTSVDWLFDASGGNGLLPPQWPPHPGRLVGYAGGINPSNVLAVIDQISAADPYWLDMESGVRTDNRFDLSLCRQVCELVYPEVEKS